MGGNVTFGELQMQFSSVRTKNEWDQEKNGLQSDNEAAIYALQVNWLLFFFQTVSCVMLLHGEFIKLNIPNLSPVFLIQWFWGGW